MGDPLRLALIPVAPTGTRTAYGHIAYRDKPHAWGPIVLDEYPPSERGEALLRLRLDHATLTRREVAAALGIGPADHSALESGQMTLSDEQWEAALAAVRVLAGGSS